jgi:hypothetical protein
LFTKKVGAVILYLQQIFISIITLGMKASLANIHPISTALSALLLVACTSASASKTYTPEGKLGFSINCSGVEKDWGMCYQKAGSLCENKGYDILDVTGETGTTTDVKTADGLSTTKTTTTHNRIMIIQCKAPNERRIPQ